MLLYPMKPFKLTTKPHSVHLGLTESVAYAPKTALLQDYTTVRVHNLISQDACMK